MLRAGPAPEGAFWDERLAPATMKRALRHLVRGCTSCWTLVARTLPLETPLWHKERLPDDAYDGAIDRAWRKVTLPLPGLEKDRCDRVQGVALLRSMGGDINGVPDRDLRSWRLWTYVEIMLQESQDYRYSKPGEMLMLVKLQQSTVDKLEAWPFGAKLLSDLRARVWGELANAYRVNEKYQKAGESFRTAHGHLNRGTSDPALRARLLDLESSLLRDQQHFDQALELLDDAFGLYSTLGDLRRAAKALMQKGSCLMTARRPEKGLRELRKAAALIDPTREPRLAAGARHNLANALVDCGKLAEAGRVLFKSNLRQVFADEPLNLLRVRWVDAKLLAGRGRFDDAERVFGEVRAGFREQGLRYDAALVGVDLALVLLKQEKDIYGLVGEMQRECFARGIKPEAAQALNALEQAARLRLVTIPFVERVRSFLVRLQLCPTLRFERDGLAAG